MEELAWLLERPAFTVDGEPFSWGDVLLSAELRGTLAELRRETGVRAARARRLQVDRGELKAAAERFRYGRGLLSAEELETWLDSWHLALGEWTAYLERALLSARDDGDPAADDVEISREVAVDAICSGFLEREARRLGADAVLGSAGPGDRRAQIAAFASSAAAARAALARAADVEHEVGARSLEWTRLDAELLELSDGDTAREAALCVRDDGRSLADVAADCGEPLVRRALYLQEAEREHLPELLGAGPGELLGPLARGDAFLLVHVVARTRPSAGDPELRSRAQAYLVEHAIERELETRVRFT